MRAAGQIKLLARAVYPRRQKYQTIATTAADSSKDVVPLLKNPNVLSSILKQSLWDSHSESWDVIHMASPHVSKQSGLQHIEVTQDHVRLEFNTTSWLYQSFADVYFASRDSEENRDGDDASPTRTAADLDSTSLPEWMIPVEIRNLAHVGAGATVLLSRKKIRSLLSAPQQMLPTSSPDPPR